MRRYPLIESTLGGISAGARSLFNFAAQRLGSTIGISPTAGTAQFLCYSLSLKQ